MLRGELIIHFHNSTNNIHIFQRILPSRKCFCNDYHYHHPRVMIFGCMCGTDGLNIIQLYLIIFSKIQKRLTRKVIHLFMVKIP